MFRSLSGRFLFLTILFVLLAEILIFVPSVADYRYEYLRERLERADIAALTKSALVEPAIIDADTEAALLDKAGVQSIAFQRDGFRELMLSRSMPGMVEASFDLDRQNLWTLIRDAVRCMMQPGDRAIRITGTPDGPRDYRVEATLYEGPLKAAMLDFAQRILFLSLFIAILTAALLYVAVRRFVARPMGRVVSSMTAFRDNPEDANRFIMPSSGITELREAETALQDMQQHVSGSLKQKDRLAQLGSAVAKISHDLRNMLTTAQLLADRFETSDDPTVTRTAPKLIGSLSRAINLCEQTLTFGKSEEPEPKMVRLDIGALIGEVIEAEELRATGGGWSIEADVPERMTIEGDPEQLFRVIVNLARNARQAITASGRPGTVRLSARAGTDGAALIEVADTGPGLPKKAREHLFKPFEGGTRRDGTGLGLAIAEELVRGHGGKLSLVRTGPEGTLFRILLPNAAPEVASGPRAVSGT